MSGFDVFSMKAFLIIVQALFIILTLKATNRVEYDLPCPGNDGIFTSLLLRRIGFEHDVFVWNLEKGSADGTGTDGENGGELDEVVGRLWKCQVLVVTTVDPNESGIWSSNDIRNADAQEMPPDWSA